MGKLSQLVAERDEAESALARVMYRPTGKQHREAVIDRETGEMMSLANSLHHQLGAVPECLPLPGAIVERLRSVRGLVDAILKADERSAGGVA